MRTPSLRNLFFLFSLILFSFSTVPIANALPGDIDDSGRVDGFDLVTFARAFNSTSSDAHWNSNADLNGDGQIDDTDLAILKDHFGKTGVSQNSWVADEYNQSVVRLAGKTGQEVFRSATGVTGYTRGIWGNPSDSSAWVSDISFDRIIKLSPAGEVLKTINGFNNPEGISVDTLRGVIWVADKSGNRIIRVNTDAADGYTIGTDTGSHAIISGFSSPVSVSVNTTDGSCWVADTYNNRVIKLQPDTPDGYDLTSDSGFHLIVTGFYRPYGVSVNNITGACWVTDTSNNQVVKLSASGSEEFRVDGFYNPAGLSVNPLTGACWVADKSNDEVVKLSADGGILARITGFNDPLSVSVDVVRGDCWVADNYNDQVVKLSPSGRELLRLSGFNNPASISAVPPTDGNEGPVAAASANTNQAAVGETITFDGGGSSSTGHTIVRYQWDFDGNGTIDSDSANPTATHSYTGAGTYSATLTVTNDIWLTDTAHTDLIRVGTLTPVVSATPSSGTAPLAVTFTFDAIDPIDGRVQKFLWDFDGNGIFEQEEAIPGTVNHTYTTPGTYTPTVKIVDSGNVSVTAQLTITVSQALPTASTNAQTTQGSAPLAVNFNGSGADVDGTVVFYEWDFDGDGTFDWFSHSSGIASFLYENQGSFQATLRVTDNDGNQASADQTITVITAVADLPTASFTATPTEGNSPLTVDFDANGSTTPVGTITDYSWDFGDTNSGNGAAPSHTFTQAGTYTVTLTITNSDGGTDTLTAEITVVDTGLPTAVAEADKTSGIAPLSVSLIATSSHDDLNPAGTITKYEWYFGDTAVVLSDDMESGATLWQPDQPWAIINTDAHSGSNCWTDSPTGDYANNANTSLTTNSFSLAALSPATPTTLKFWHHYATESGYDEARVEISTDGGTNWIQLTYFSGSQVTWHEVSVDLTTYAGEADVRIRFRLTPDGYITGDGWYIDDVKVEAAEYTETTTPANTPHTFSQPGTFTPLLRVTDNDGNTDTDTITITVSDGPPVAVAAATPLSGIRPLTVDFDASASSDPNGTIATYEWSFEGLLEDGAESGLGSWTVASTRNTAWGITSSSVHNGSYSFNDSPGGNYDDLVETSLTSSSLDLTASTNTTLSFWHHHTFKTYASGMVEISTDNGTSWTTLNTYTGSQADWTQVIVDLNTYDGQPSVKIRFRMHNNSYNNDKGWYVDDIDIRGDNTFIDVTSTPASTQHTFTNFGTYNPILRVTDDSGLTATDSVAVSAYTPPTATIISPTANSSYYLENISFSGNGTDADGFIVLYEWDFDGDTTYDWSSTTGADTIYQYTASGSFTATLRVTDNHGLTNTASITLNINETQPANFNLSVSQPKGYVLQDITFDGSATDADGSIVQYEWDFDNDGTYDWASVGGARVISYTSQYDTTNWAAENLIDGGVGSSMGWSSAYKAPFPQEIIFELPQAASWNIDKVVIDPSTTNSATYWTKDFEILASNTDSRPASFTSLGMFTLANTAGEQIFNLQATQARYLMLRILSNYGNANYIQMGEVSLFSGNTSLLSPLTARTSHTYTTPGDHVARLRATDNDGNQATAAITTKIRTTDFLFASMDMDPERGYNPLTVNFSGNRLWDDFSLDTLASRWGSSFGNNNWIVENGILKETQGSGTAASSAAFGVGLLFGDAGWADYTVTADIYSTDDDTIGIIFRYQNDSSYYLFEWNKQSSFRRLSKRTAGTVTTLAGDNVPYVSNQWYTVQIDAVGNTITVTIDGSQIFSVTDGDYTTGMAGLWGNYNAQSWFDNVRIRQGNLTYAWDIDGNAGTDATTATTSHTYTEAGTYDLSLIVSDGTDTDTVTGSLVVKPQGEGFIAAWVADTNNDRILVLEPDGITERKKIYGFSYPVEVFTDPPRNNVWVLDHTLDKVFRFADDVPDGYNAITGDNYHAMSTGWNNPSDLDFTTSGTWVVDRNNDRLINIPANFTGYLPDGVTASSPEMTTNGYTADAVGGPTIITGKIGNAVSLSGTSTGEYISLPYEAVSGLSDFTVETWFTHTYDHTGFIMSGARKLVYNAFLVELYNSTTIRIHINNSYKTFTTPDLDDGQFHHLAVTRAGDQISLYIDGAQAGTAQTLTTATIDLDLGGLFLGQDQDSLGGGFSTSQTLVGAVDDLRIWDHARSLTEINATKNNALVGNETGLQAYYPFDQLNTPRTPLITITGFTDPREVAVNPTDGTVWVTDSGLDKVFRFDASVPDGYNISTDSGSHISLTGFFNPYGIAVNHTDGTAWVADYSNDQIVHLAADGSGEIARIGGFNDPNFIEINQQDGTIWVADYTNDQIVHLNNDGSLELSRTGGFYYIDSIAVDQRSGQCWVSDHGYDFVRRLAPDGTLLSSKTGLYDPYGLAVMSLSAAETTANPPQITSALSDVSSGQEGTTVNFTATATDNGTVVSYTWDFDGDGIFDTPTGSSVSHTYDQFGFYVPRVRVKDNEGLFASKTLSPITIGSTKAIIDAQPATGFAPLTVNFNGTCFDPADLSCTFDWEFGDGVTRANDPSHAYRYNQAGLYRATLTATNSNGTAATSTQLINVIARPPVASATVDPVSGLAPLAVNLQGSGTDADGTVTRYQWDYNSDGIYDYHSTSSGNTFFVYDSPGLHQATLKVTDNDGLSATTSKLIQASGPPVITLTATPTFGNVPLQVSFDATGTVDNDSGDSIASYLWDFGDNSTANGVQANHTYDTAGTYQAKLTATDTTGLSASQEMTIKVYAAGLPLAVAEASPTIGPAPLQVQLTGNNSTDDGTITQYDWFFGEGYQLDANGYPTTQLFIGPWVSTGCGDITSHQTGIENSNPGIGLTVDNKNWFVASDTDGNFNWDGVFGSSSNTYAYSHIYVYSETQQDVLIKFGADDAARLWVNGTLEFSKAICEGISTDKYTPQVTLNQGWNSVLFSVSEGGSSWGLAYRITDTSGNALQLPYSLNRLIGIPDFSYTSPTTGNVSHTYNSSGLYDAILTVIDNDANQSSSSVTINVTIANPPTAQAAAIATEGATPFTARFTGTGTDANGTIVLYEWDFDGDGVYDWNSTSSGTTTYIYTSTDIYQATLRVTDNEGNTDTDTIQMVSGILPEARPYVFPLRGNAPLAVQFSSNGHDEDGTIVNYQWDLDGNGQMDPDEQFGDLNGDGWPDNPSEISTAFPYTYTMPGTYNATLTVTDNDGLSSSTAVTVIVEQPQQPTASITVNGEEGNVPLTVTFEGFGTDYDGTLVSYSWDFGDNTTGNSQQVSHTYTQLGIYTATLTVTDNDGNTGSSFVHIRAKEEGMPTATASADKTSAQSSFTVNLTGTGTDTDGDIVLYEWDFDGDGTFDYSSASSGNVIHNYSVAGTYEAAFRVTDNDGRQDIDFLTLDVLFGIDASRGVEMFDPTLSQSAIINYSLTAPATITLTMLDRQFNTVKTLLQDSQHTPGAYRTTWDGTDNSGQIVASGVYYFVIDYVVNGRSGSLNLTGDVSLARRAPSKTNINTFNTLEDRPLFVQFNLDKPSETTVYVAIWVGGSPVWVGDRVKTPWLREPRPKGGYVVVWDGTDDEGNIMPPGTYLWSVIAYDLPDNAIIVHSRPEISDVSKEPDFFMPAANQYKSSPDSQLVVSFRLSKAATVNALIKNENNIIVRTLTPQSLGAGANQLSWDGRNDAGDLVTPGTYRMRLQATDASGNQSTSEYSLFRVFY